MLYSNKKVDLSTINLFWCSGHLCGLPSGDGEQQKIHGFINVHLSFTQPWSPAFAFYTEISIRKKSLPKSPCHLTLPDPCNFFFQGIRVVQDICWDYRSKHKQTLPSKHADSYSCKIQTVLNFSNYTLTQLTGVISALTLCLLYTGCCAKELALALLQVPLKCSHWYVLGVSRTQPRSNKENINLQGSLRVRVRQESKGKCVLLENKNKRSDTRSKVWIKASLWNRHSHYLHQAKGTSALCPTA